MHDHTVQFYQDSQSYKDVVGDFAVASLRAGETCIIIATPEHRELISEHLHSHGLEALLSSPRFMALDAEETRSIIVRDDKLDLSHIHAFLGATIQQAIHSGNGRVSIFGEVVALMVADGRAEQAAELEAIWNGLLPIYNRNYENAVESLCAYPVQTFLQAGDDLPALLRICAEHSQVSLPGDFYHPSRSPAVSQCH